MNRNPKVSIILTSYNHAPFLRAAIESALQQSYTNFELNIIDDGSTDESWEIINRYTDPRIRAFRSETNQRGTYTRQRFLDIATEKYIAIHHSDDIWEPDKLERQMTFLDAHPEVGAVFTWAQIIDENGQPFQNESHFYSRIFEQPNRTRHEWLNHFFHNGNALCHPSVLIRRECYQECGIYRFGLAQLPDFDMWVRLCLKYEIHVLPEKLVRFRIRANEANTSGIRPDTRIRWQFEFLQVLDNYKAIPSMQELVQVFPNAEKYITPQGYDLGFALAMIALESKNNQLTEFFGLNLLFDIFNNREHRQRLKDLYNFSQPDFIALTGQHDIFSIEQRIPLMEEISELNREIVDREAEIARLQLKLDTASTTLAEIYATKGWRLLESLRWLRRQQIRIGRLFTGLFLLLIHPRDMISLLRSALNVFHREGWTGVIPAIRYYINYYVETGKSGGNFGGSSLYHYLRSGRRGIYSGTASEKYAPKVSVIVPNYNHSAYLEERLNSIYAQTYQNFEVILLDDCSTDDSVSILNEYAAKYPVKTRCYYNEVNSGSPFAQWEKGISLAEGELIWIAESDDSCDRNFLEKLIPPFFDDAVLLSYAHPVFMDENGRRHIFAFENYARLVDSKKWKSSYVETAHNEVNTALGLLNTIPNVGGAVFRKPDNQFPLFKDPEWKTMRVCGDWLFYLHLIRGGLVVFNRETHNYYRIYETSTSKKTHSRDVFYQEHERIAMAVARLYKIPDELLLRLQARLRDFYFKNVEDGSAEKFEALFNLDKIRQSMQGRQPNVLMTTYGLATGGGEIFPVRLANALHHAGAAVTMFNGGYEPTQPGVRKMLAPQIALLTNSTEPYVDNMLANFGIEIIHTHHASMENYFAAKRSVYGGGVKHIATLHGMYEMMSNSDFIYNTKDILKSVDHWVYTAEKNTLPFKKNGIFTAEKFTPMDNGLPLQKFNKVDLSPLGITPESFTACLASRAIPEKGWMEAIEATQTARDRTGMDIHLLLIGNGPMHDILKERDLPGFIHLLGFKANVGDYLASAQVGLLPSYFKGESFPFVMIEFFIAEIPVITSNIGETSRMIRTPDNKSAGLLIELRNGKVIPGELADAMTKMVSDKEFYNECVNATRLLKSRYDIDNIAQQYLAVYQRSLGDRY